MTKTNGHINEEQDFRATYAFAPELMIWNRSESRWLNAGEWDWDFIFQGDKRHGN